MKQQAQKIIFTGGHHNSALVVAIACQEIGYEIYWFGHRQSMWGDTTDSAEYVEVTKQKIKFFDLRAGKLYRTFNPIKLARIPLGFIQAYNLLAKIKPDCIVSFGGYLAVPTVIAGWLLGIPSITHEQTVSAGWANKIIAKFATKIAISWPTSAKYYPSQKTVLTGLPLRKELLLEFKKPKKTNLHQLYITGGKQGSHIINMTVFSLINQLTQKYDVIHQTGTASIFNDQQMGQSIKNDHYISFGYSSEKAVDALLSAEIVISRAGAHTIYELGYLGKKSVLIPLPNSSHQEQYCNAKELEKAGLAIILPQEKMNNQSLLLAVEQAKKLPGKALNLPVDATEKMIQIIKLLCETKKS